MNDLLGKVTVEQLATLRETITRNLARIELLGEHDVRRSSRDMFDLCM